MTEPRLVITVYSPTATPTASATVIIEVDEQVVWAGSMDEWSLAVGRANFSREPQAA
jgi:hypothetical protein